jgi:hypothetical protein
MPEKWTLRLPFDLPENVKFDEMHDKIDELNISIKYGTPHSILLVNGFKTEDEAKVFVDKFNCSFLWTSINLGLGFKVTNQRSSIVYSEDIGLDPALAADNLRSNFGIKSNLPVHGIGDDHLFSIYKENQNIKFIGVGQARIVMTYKGSQLIESLKEGLKYNISNNKTKLALELFVSHCYELSQNVKFLTLVTSLEALLPSTKRSDVITKIIDITISKLQKEKDTINIEEIESLTALIEGIRGLKSESIGKRLRKIVLDSFNKINDLEAPQRAQEITELYKKRSTLTHRGTSIIKHEDIENLKRIVKGVLRARIIFDSETNKLPPTYDQIKELAYHRWKVRQGDSLGDWLTAERELK